MQHKRGEFFALLLMFTDFNLIGGNPNAVVADSQSSYKTKKNDAIESKYWTENAQNYIQQVIFDPKIMSMSSKSKAKNIIYFLGDGMSLTTIASARLYLGGEHKSLSFEKFQHFGLSKTYCVDKQVADSACSSTAYLSGVKANYGTMGLSANIPLNSCKGQNNVDEHTVTIAKWAQNQGKATGLVTTSKVTDATPGGLYAHIANRYWENDKDVMEAGCSPIETKDIARQFVENEVSQNFKIVLACGRNEFRDSSMHDEEFIQGKRSDKRDLINEWIDIHNKKGKTAYIHDKNGMKSISNNTEFILGLFHDDHCPYNMDIKTNNWADKKPSLSEMTRAAIKHLQKFDTNGFFLFVEGSKIDLAHHDNMATLALDETKEFSKAVETAKNMTDEDDTLIVVTSDHSHTMTYSGYSTLGSDILGLSDKNGSDGLPYTKLSYANGPGFYQTFDLQGGRIDLSKYDLSNPRHSYPASVPLVSETHGGDDVGIYINGPMSFLFEGNYEQSYIPLLIAYVAEIGPYANSSTSYLFVSTNFLVLTTIFIMIYMILVSNIIIV